MRITCLITVCAYLLSTVSTDEIQYLNRIKTRSREELSVGNTTARKELNPNPAIRSNVFPTLRKPRPQGQIETIQKSFQNKVHGAVKEFQPKPQQQHPRDRSRRPIKRLNVRSIGGSTYEVDEIHSNEFIHEPVPEVHDKGPIFIKPVFRVVTKKNSLFDSIINVLHQLLDPPKKESGPVVGPIKMPGSTRKIYMRLLEPVDSSHVNVRFVTEVPVPVVSEEPEESVLPYLPFVDPAVTLLKRHPIGSSDATFSSSNRQHSIQLPRNTSHVSGKSRGLKPVIKPMRPPKDFKEVNKENIKPVKEVVNEGESDKNPYYQYQTGDDAVKHVTEIIKNATENEQGTLEPWYQLNTHRLPLRQIAPLYPLSAMEHAAPSFPHTASSSYENAYQVPGGSLSPHPSSYEQYSDVPPGVYDQPYTVPNTYSTTYQKENEFSNAPSSYSISYQNQNEFNNAPSSTSYVKQNDLFSAPSMYTSSYEKPANVSPPLSFYATSHEAQNGIQTGSSSQNALRVINPPTYLLNSGQVSENHTNKVYTAQNDERLPIDQVTRGKVKREKSQTNFQHSREITPDNRDNWQPLTFIPENADWHKAFANLAKVANGNHYETVAKQQSVVPKQATPSTTEAVRINQRQNSKRHNPSSTTTRNSRCLTGDKCERTESTIVSTPRAENIIKPVQTQSVTNLGPIVITPKLVASSTAETLRSNVVTKSSWIEEPQKLVMIENFATISTTEKSPLLLQVRTEKSIEHKTILSGSMMSNLTQKSVTRSTTERSSISGTSVTSTSKSTTRRLLPKRPMIMKKPTTVFKRMETSSTTKKPTTSSTTKKPTTSRTTQKTKTTRQSKYRGAISKTKSSTT